MSEQGCSSNHTRCEDTRIDTDIASEETNSGAAEDAEDTAPIKATFYLEPKTVEALEDLWLSLRKKPHRFRISKSQIVTSILNDGLRQLKELPLEKQAIRLAQS
jgi:hypothetical protein